MIKGLGGRCLDVYGYNSADGARLVTWDCHGDVNQRWRLAPSARGGVGLARQRGSRVGSLSWPVGGGDPEGSVTAVSSQACGLTIFGM